MARGDRPNYATRKRYLMALASAVCMTCGGALDWTTTGKADSGTFGHILADSLGGKWTPENIGAQCWTCNRTLAALGMLDLRGIGNSHYFRYVLPSQSEADEWYAKENAYDIRQREWREAICKEIANRR